MQAPQRWELCVRTACTGVGATSVSLQLAMCRREEAWVRQACSHTSTPPTAATFGSLAIHHGCDVRGIWPREKWRSAVSLRHLKYLCMGRRTARAAHCNQARARPTHTTCPSSRHFVLGRCVNVVWVRYWLRSMAGPARSLPRTPRPAAVAGSFEARRSGAQRPRLPCLRDAGALVGPLVVRFSAGTAGRRSPAPSPVLAR